MLFGDERPVEPPDEFFGFARKHAATDNFDPAGLTFRFMLVYMGLNKHPRNLEGDRTKSLTDCSFWQLKPLKS